MSEPGAGPAAANQLFEEAAGWFARMRGPGAEASREEFDAWLALGSAQRSAYNRAAEIFALGKLLEDKAPASEQPPSRLSSRQRALAGSPALLLIAVAASWVALGPVSDGYRQIAQRASTDAKEEQFSTPLTAGRSLRLLDGSLVELAEASLLRVSFGTSERRLILEQGAARFIVAHEKRPFLVLAGGAVITARGTMFDVGFSSGGRVRVRLIEGVIDVALPRGDGRSRPIQRLRSGEAISFPTEHGRASITDAGTRRDPEAAALPGADPRDFDAISVAELVAIANQGTSRPIRIGVPAIGQYRVSGRFRTSDTRLLAERLAGLFSLTVDARDPSQLTIVPK